MTHSHSYRSLAIVALAVFVALGATTGGAAAAGGTTVPTPPTDAGANQTTTTTTTSSDDGANITQNVNVDLGGVTVESWTWDASSKEMILHLSAETPTRVKITDYGRAIEGMQNADGAGGQRSSGTGYNLQSGENTLRISPYVTDDGGVYLGIGTTGDAYSLWTKGVGGGSTLPPATWGAVLAVAVAALLVFGGGTYYWMSRRVLADEDPILERMA